MFLKVTEAETHHASSHPSTPCSLTNFLTAYRCSALDGPPFIVMDCSGRNLIEMPIYKSAQNERTMKPSVIEGVSGI